MSKRFGRNQKRAFRAQIDQYAKSLEMDRALLSRQRSQIDSLNSALRDVARELGEHFYGLPVVRRSVEQINHNYRIPAQIPGKALEFLQGDELCYLVSSAAHHLSFMTSQIERDQITGSVHILLETPDGRQAYGLSMTAWESMKRDAERMRHQILPMIASDMARFIARGKS